METAGLLLRAGATLAARPPGPPELASDSRRGTVSGGGGGGGQPRDAECPLHCAVRAGSGPGAADCVQLLLEVGADPRCVEAGADGWTPLHIAADRGATRIVKVSQSLSSEG